MPRLNDNTDDPPPGELVVRPVSQGCVDVEYVPSKERLLPKERLLQAGVPDEHVDRLHTRLLHVDALQGEITIFPINTNPKKENFLKPKYDQVSQIIIGGQSLVRLGSCPANQEDVMVILESLPSCFVKDFDFGLGFTVDHSPIVDAVESLSECSVISISNKHETHIDHAPKTFCISVDDCRRSRRNVQKTLRAGQTITRMMNRSDTYNHLNQSQGEMRRLWRPSGVPDHSPSTDERSSLAQPSQSSSPLECTPTLALV